MNENLRNNFIHLFILLVLIIGLLAVLLYTGLVSCGSIPGSCDLYYQVLRGGQPQVLIAYNESGGLGDPAALEAVLSSREILNARVKRMNMDRLTIGNVTDYELIIVEGARKICTDQLNVFMHFVNMGGRLVWTGDAGTELCSKSTGDKVDDTYMLDSERNEGGKTKILNPWARKGGGKQVNFDEFLGVAWVGRRCELAECKKGDIAGYAEIVTNDNKLVYGLSPSVPITGDFGVTEIIEQSDTRMVAALDYGFPFTFTNNDKPWLEKGKRYSLPRKLPFIVSSQVGGRVAYYAIPIEVFVSEEQPQKNKAFIEQMYYGMLYK